MTIFDDMIPDMLSKKKVNQIVTEQFIRGRKLNIALVFITQSHFAVPKSIRINSTHYLIMKILTKQKLQQIVFNNSPDTDVKDFTNIYLKRIPKPYSLLVINCTLASDIYLRCIKKILERM